MTRPQHIELAKSRHGRPTVYFRAGKGPRIRMPDDMESAEFAEAYAIALEQAPVEDVRSMPVTAVTLRKQRAEKVIRCAVRSARARARSKGVPFDLDLDFLLAMAVKQDFRCAITGIEFFAKNEARCRVDPYTPSIDRIEPGLGYQHGNVRLVIFAVNAMLLDWGEPLFIQIANSYRYWTGTKTRHLLPEPYRKLPAPQKSRNDFNEIRA